MNKLNKGLWFLYEETVMKVAGVWSINPTEIENLSLDEDSGILAFAPGNTENSKLNTD